MLKIKPFIVNPIGENTYVVSDDTGEGIIIDPGCFTQSEWDAVTHYIYKEGIAIRHILLTHCHIDHVLGCHYANKSLGIQPTCHTDDIPLYRTVDVQARAFFGDSVSVPELPRVGKALNGGEEIVFGNHTIKVIHTPGHSQGCVCYLLEDENVIFTGDTLFAGSMGRTDLSGGNDRQMIHSLLLLAGMAPSLRVYPGHGLTTTIENERTWILPNFKA